MCTTIISITAAATSLLFLLLLLLLLLLMALRLLPLPIIVLLLSILPPLPVLLLLVVVPLLDLLQHVFTRVGRLFAVSFASVYSGLFRTWVWKTPGSVGGAGKREFVFDYRTLEGSNGMPRNLVDPWR